MRGYLVALAVWILGAMPLTAQSAFWKTEWPETDFSRTSLSDWTQIVSGGPGKDGIPALTLPDFIPATQETSLGPSEAVIQFQLDGHPARAYPLRYLMWHEIINDRIGDRSVTVTYCPLCNSALVFDALLDGRVLEFGVSGKLRNSDMVMYDRQTQSWWQQAIGTAIVGEMTGARLTSLPSRMVGWAQFVADHPDGQVMKMPDYPRPYGVNPYRNYDLSTRPFLYSGENPPHGIPPLARVVRVGDRAWLLDRLRRAGRLEEAGVTLLWQTGLASALEAGQVSAGRDVGSVRVLDAGGADVVHDVMFAFAFYAFWPDGGWMLGD